jgi:hypothetical protein
MCVKNLTGLAVPQKISALFLFLMLMPPLFAERTMPKILQVESEIQKSLNKFCLDCHYDKKQKGDVRLDNFSKLSDNLKFEMLNKIEEQIYLEQMPPKDEDILPTNKERQSWLATIAKWNELKSTKSMFRSKLVKPEYGNYVDHNKLFSGEYKDLKGFTYDRDWVISEFIFIDKMNTLLYGNQSLSIHGKKQKTKGLRLDVKIVNPFLLPTDSGIRYYANEKINSSHFLSMIGNSEHVSNSMIGYLSKKYKDYLPAVQKVTAMRDSHNATLASRKEYLDNAIDKLCADLDGDKNEPLLPAYTKIKLEGEINNKVRRYGKNGTKGRIGTDGPLLYAATQRFGRSSKSKKEIIEKCEKFWFHSGYDIETVGRLKNLVRKELASILTYKNLIAMPKIKSLKSAEMKVITSTIKKLRKQDMSYQTLKNKCMNYWSQEFQQIREKSNPLQAELLHTLVNQLFDKIYERLASEKELKDKSQLLKKYAAKMGVDGAIRKLTQTLILSSEFISRNEYGVGKVDKYGRKMLSPRNASYAISYAITDSAPDEQLAKAAREGKLNTRDDYKREVERLIKDYSQYYVIDNAIQSDRGVSSVTNTPIRKLRFFREFFGYYLADKVFKDQARWGGGLNSVRARLIAEADMLVEHIIEKDKNVFEELLGTENFYVYHNTDNKHMLEVCDQMKNAYEYFKNSHWKKFRNFNDLAKHKEFLKKPGVPGLVVKKKVDKKTFNNFINIMCSFEARFSKSNKYIAPYLGVRFLKFGASKRVTARNNYLLGASGVTKFFNINQGQWDYPPEQPAKVQNRKGMLTHPAWLQAFSQNAHTDPVTRGKWIREKLLAATIPDVPIDVEAVIPEDHTKTLRQRLEDVTGVKECWKCHKLMNPLGNAFEMYDDFGRFRTKEALEHPDNILVEKPARPKKVKLHPSQSNPGRVGKRIPPPPKYKTAPVVTTGVLEGTGNIKLDGKVKDAVDMISRLVKSKRVRQSIIRHAFRYFMGRNEMLSDSKTLIDADEAYVKSGGSFDAVIVSLLTSDSFIYRKEIKE